MTRTENKYPEEVVRLAVVLTSLTGTPGDESTYEYAKAARSLADYGHRIPESTLLRWVRQHPDYVSDIKLVFDEAVHNELKGIIDVGAEITRMALEKIRDKLRAGGDLTPNEIKMVMTTVAIAMDKKKVLDAAKYRNENEDQDTLDFSPGSAPKEVIEPPDSHLKADGSPAPPVHDKQTDLTSATLGTVSPPNRESATGEA